MAKRLNKCILISAVTLCVGCAYALFCRLTGLGIPCLFHLATGLNCPGCGVSRMLLSLLRLDFPAAFHYNAVLFCLLPVLLGLFGAEVEGALDEDGCGRVGRLAEALPMDRFLTPRRNQQSTVVYGKINA